MPEHLRVILSPKRQKILEEAGYPDLKVFQENVEWHRAHGGSSSVWNL